MPSSLIFSRTCFTSSAPPGCWTWASRSVIAVSSPYSAFPRCARRASLPAVQCLFGRSSFLASPLIYSDVASAPRERRVRGRMQLALGEAAEAERPEQVALVAADIVRHQLAD